MQDISYIGDGITTEYTFDFPFYDDSNIIVLINNNISTNYTVFKTPGGLNADIPYIGGKIVFNTAPNSMDIITITRDIALDRIFDYQPTEKINPTDLNQDMNYMLEILKDMKNKLDIFNKKYKDIVQKDDIQDILTRINYIKQLFDNNKILGKDEFYSYITNSILYIPQNLKFELNDGILKLKSGAKIYIPNGSGVFDTVITSSDLSVSRSDSNKCMVWFNNNSNTLSIFPISLFYSGPTAPNTYQFMYWYDTLNNKCKTTTNTGSTWEESKSFPLCIVSTDGTKISAIDQIFNGFGYVGSTVFALPGITCLIPNGRNDNGSLKSIFMTNNSVITRTGLGTNISGYKISLNASGFFNYASDYILGQDGFLHVQNGTIYKDIVLGVYSTNTDGKITSFTPENVLKI